MPAAARIAPFAAFVALVAFHPLLEGFVGPNTLVVAAAGQAVHRDFRPGDVRMSRADISKARRLLGYRPTHDVRAGLERAIDWYVARLGPARVGDSLAAAAE